MIIYENKDSKVETKNREGSRLKIKRRAQTYKTLNVNYRKIN